MVAGNYSFEEAIIASTLLVAAKVLLTRHFLDRRSIWGDLLLLCGALLVVASAAFANPSTLRSGALVTGLLCVIVAAILLWKDASKS